MIDHNLALLLKKSCQFPVALPFLRHFYPKSHRRTIIHRLCLIRISKIHPVGVDVHLRSVFHTTINKPFKLDAQCAPLPSIWWFITKNNFIFCIFLQNPKFTKNFFFKVARPRATFRPKRGYSERLFYSEPSSAKNRTNFHRCDHLQLFYPLPKIIFWIFTISSTSTLPSPLASAALSALPVSMVFPRMWFCTATKSSTSTVPS